MKRLFILGTYLNFALVACSQKEPAPASEIPPVVLRQTNTSNKLQMTEKHEYLEIRLSNESGGLIEETSIDFGENRCTFGMFKTGHSSTYLGWIKPIGTNAVVRWKDAKKIEGKATIDFSQIYDSTKPGTLSFTITGTNVTVGFTPIERK